MRIEINAPDLPLAQICEAAELFADYLGLHTQYNGAGTIICRGQITTVPRATQKVKPLVSIVAGNSAERAARAMQALRRILPCAPEGAVLATDGRRYGILPHPDETWLEVRS